MQISKKEEALRRFAGNLELFRCPICQESFRRHEEGFRCLGGHHFDLARSGYLNLYMGSQSSIYDRSLFAARQQVFMRGVYDPLIAEAASLIQSQSAAHPVILDAGCGEGSFLARLQGRFSGPLIGVDISKDGIRLAAASYRSAMWCVGDLASLPLADSCTDVILNVLSPANYGEFQRVLKPGGMVIKVVPGPAYLQEIRERLQGSEDYSNDEVLSLLEERLEIVQQKSLYYRVPVDQGLWKALVEMTPLTQHRRVEGLSPKTLTVDLLVVKGMLDFSR